MIGDRARVVVALATPVALGLLVQNAMSLITLAIVGRLGDAALAGVGVANALVSILLALLFGLDAGVQALTAQRLGARDPAGAGAILTQGLRLSGAAGVILTLVAWLAGPAAIGGVLHDARAASEGSRFLAGYAPILLALAGNMTFSAYWNGAGAPAWPFVICLVQAPVHLALNLALALGVAGTPALGTFGAGLGSSLAALFALGLHIALATRLRPIAGLRLQGLEWPEIRSLFAIGAPVSLQGAMLSVGAIVYFGVIARLGVAAVAAVNVMNSLMLIFVLAASGFGVAAATLVGRALGQGKARDARRAGWEVAALCAALTAILALVLALAPEAVLGVFIARPETLMMAATPLRIVALSVGLSSFALTISYALRGAGATKAPALASFALQWFLQIPLSWLVGVRLGYGLPGVACVLFFSAAIEAAVMALIWRTWARRQSANGDTPAIPAGLSELA